MYPTKPENKAFKKNYGYTCLSIYPTSLVVHSQSCSESLAVHSARRLTTAGLRRRGEKPRNPSPTRRVSRLRAEI
jgi:hypothetical protein